MKKIFVNGKIYLNPGRFASALCVENGLVTAVGTREEALSQGRGEVVDLKGRTVVPGFNDSHLHLLHCWFFLERANVSGASSIDEVIARCRDWLAAHPEKSVLVGRGWNHDRFIGEKRLLNRRDLDRISTEIPVILTRNCGHVAAVNSKAVETLKLGPDFPVEAGGRLGYDADGRCNGILYETAVNQVKYLINEPYSRMQIWQNLQKIAALANAAGITSVSTNDLYLGYPDAKAVEGGYHMYARNNPTIRVNHQISFYDLETLKKRLASGYDRSGNPAFNRYGPVKLFADGSLGGRTALLSRPYADDPTTRGQAVTGPEALKAFFREASAHGLQCVAHAIGDQGIENVLDAIESVNGGENNPLRHGIIHAALPRPDQLRRLAAGRVPVLVQPVNLRRNASGLAEKVGEELASYASPYKTMLKNGIPLCFGSDGPIAPFDVMTGIHCAVNRQDSADAAGGFRPEEGLSVEEAVDAYTLAGARISFEESVKGRLLPGYYADFAVLSDDIFTIGKTRIRDIRVEMTMVGGRIVFTR